MLKYVDRDCFPNMRKLLAIECISPVGLTEAERESSVRSKATENTLSC